MNDTVKLANFENPQFGTEICDISAIQADFLFKYPNFVKRKFSLTASPAL